MKYIREFATEADIQVDATPNVVFINDTKKLIYNYFPKGVFIQHINGKLYTADEWTAKGFPNGEANGVAVSADECRFVIAKNDISGTKRWASNVNSMIDGIFTTTDLSTAKSDYLGEENTTQMVKVDTSGAGYSCANYTFPNGKKGYLASFGEWEVAYANINAIESALVLIGGNKFGGDHYWSSTQRSDTQAWTKYMLGNFTSDYKKNSYFLVRPFTAL